MLEVKVTITLAPEVLAILQGLVSQAAQPVKVTTQPRVTNTVMKVEPKAELEDLTTVAKALLQAGKKDELKKILSDHGVTKVSALKKEQYDQVLKELNALNDPEHKEAA